MAAGDDFFKGDLYDAWLHTLDESILDETFEPLFDGTCKRGTHLKIKHKLKYS